ncbi:hypothetical protein [Nocardioides sp. Leaf307]|uniref:hypothetical protein n=1 Tax=Nocardioides sp. Leaf307 TaxID=1736331 RepID=UPI000712C835|nr:hypothetical protein [Nocardioides sp. Leaf307]KQQ42956.1 hypothetical protein ASF50_02775 [Nocardioides sp. Leaf307]
MSPHMMAPPRARRAAASAVTLLAVLAALPASAQAPVGSTGLTGSMDAPATSPSLEQIAERCVRHRTGKAEVEGWRPTRAAHTRRIVANCGRWAADQVTAPVSGTSPAPVSTLPSQPSAGIFGPLSEFRRDISTAPVASDSAAVVANVASQVERYYGGVAAFNAWQYNVSTYTVSPGLPRVDVIWDNCQGKSYLPGQLYDPARGAHFKSVPIPDNAVPAKGTDAELTIYDPATDQLWEFWKAARKADGWHACWGGRIDKVSTSPGYFRDGMGVTAAGLSAAAGSIRIAEAKARRIDHAMSLNVINAAHWSQWSYPAQRSDGAEPLGKAGVVREGQRLRLDPRLDLSRLSLHPLTRAIAEAAQKYGFIVNDKGGAVALIPESGAGTAAVTGRDPWNDILAGTPGYAVLKNFPWRHLQALPVDYGKP